MRPAALLFVAITAWGAEPGKDALAIMKELAANTDAAIEARRQYVYHQHVRSGLSKTNGQVICKESREYIVIPQEASTERKLVSFDGQCHEGTKMVPYSPPGRVQPGMRQKPSAAGDRLAAQVTSERESITSVIGDFATDPKSRDGIPRQLFPLSGPELTRYRFTLKGETAIKGRRAYDILFDSTDARERHCIDIDEYGCSPWKGEAWIDAEDYQPVRIDTQQAHSVPWEARVFLGLNFHQLGFSVTYQRVAAGVWFPATYGTEFRFTVLWGYKRTITLSMENTDFRKTDAQSTVEFESPAEQ
jgi:hypothetical protein